VGANLERLTETIRSVRENIDNSNLKLVVINNSNILNMNDIEWADEVISLGINLGFVGANEYVRRKYDSEFIWTLQDDVKFSTNVLDKLLTQMELSKKLAVVSPLVLKNGLVSTSRGGNFIDNQIREWKSYPPEGAKPDTLNPNVDFVYSSGALWRTEALNEIEGFNLKLYPSYHVDVDTCFRLIQKNWKVKLALDTAIEHQGHGSTPRLLSRVLAKVNKEILLNTYQKKETNYDAIALEIIPEIAKKSSFLILEVSKQGSNEIMELQHQIKNLTSSLQKMYNSKSWKMTYPLRYLMNFLKTNVLWKK
jgi:GT2 family glycosyltransferase